jgi:hypothetical protein
MKNLQFDGSTTERLPLLEDGVQFQTAALVRWLGKCCKRLRMLPYLK